MADENDDKATVPSSRLREETQAKREALARVAELEGRIADLEKRGATVETLTGRVQELQQHLEAERKGRSEDQTIFGAGFKDPALVRFEYSRLPEKDRPELGAWLADVQKTPEKAPASLRALLGGGEQQGEQTTERKMGAERKPAATTGTGAELGAEQARARILKLATEAQRTGDWSAYDKERPALLSAIARG